MPAELCFGPDICPGAILNIGGGLATSAAGDVASSLLSDIGSAVEQAAIWLVAQLMDLIQATTTPELGAGWFGPELGRMEQVAGVVILPVLMIATIGPVLRQDGRRLARVWGVGLPVAVFAGLAASQLAGLALVATDALSALVVGPHQDDLAKQFVQAAGAVTTAPVFVQIVLSGVTVLGALTIWLELTLRAAGVYIATFFMPLVLVAYIWPSTAELARRGVQILASLILSKFVIVAALSLGLVAVAKGNAAATVSGAAVLLMAAFAPFALLRLAPVAEAAVIAHLEGLSRRPVRAAGRAATSAATAQTHPVTQFVMSTVSAARASADGARASRPVAATPIPDKAPDYVYPKRPDSGSDHG